MKLTPEKQKNLALTIIVVVGVIVSLWYFLIQGLEKKKNNDKGTIKKLGEKVAELQGKIRKEESDRKQAESYQTYIAAQEQKMPTGNVETWLFKELSSLGDQHKLTFANTSMQPVSDGLSDFKFKGTPYKLVGYRITFNGEFNQIGNFLRDLENLKPLMEVDEITITAGSEVAPHVHKVDMRISMVAKI